MKPKVILFACAWLLCLCNAMADEFVINNVTIPQGGHGKLSVGFRFTGTSDKVGFTFSLGMPEGISLEKDEDGEPVYEKDMTSISKLNIICAGEENIGGLPSNEKATIKGTEGTLLTLTLNADAALAVGSTHTVNVTNATFQEKTEGSIKDINISDLSFIVTIGEPDDGRIKFDEKSTMHPTYIAGEKGDIRMTRTIKANQWSTIVLPFTLTKAKAEAIFGSDVQLAEFSGFEVDYGEDEDNDVPQGITINFSAYAMSAKKNMTGGKPFLIKTSKDITSFEADDCSLVSAVSDVNKTDEFDTSGKFTGTFVKTIVPADGLFISDETFYYSTGAMNIKAFRGWFELGVVLDKDADFGVKMFIDGLETSIDDVSIRDANGTIYDLSGYKVNKPQHKGIYVVNGKKTVIK